MASERTARNTRAATPRTDIFVLGGGLAGLAAAYRLKSRYCVLEKRSVPGGLCDTVEADGFRFDRTGHLLHLRSPKIKRTVLGLLDEAPLLIARRARIFSHGVYTHYPFQAHTFGLPKEVVAECLSAFIKAAIEQPKQAGAPKTFEAFIYRHFGDGIANHFMIPYNAKLWGVHPREITADWCKRFVPVPSVDEVVRGALGLHRDDMGYNATFYYPKRGIGSLTAAFARRVTHIRYNTRPDAIDHKRRRIFVSGEWLPYRALVTTLPMNELLRLLEAPPKRIRHAAQTLQCTRLRYLDVALDRPAGNDYHWTYVPEKRYPFYRVGCYSNFSPAMAPRHKSNLYVELASRRPVALDTLMPRIETGLTEMGLIKGASDIRFVRTREIRHAYVVYNQSYSSTVPRVLSWLERHGIYAAGRYASWEYAAMEDAISQGFDAAKKAKEHVA